MGNREYTAEMTEYLKERIPDGDYIPHMLALKIIEELKGSPAGIDLLTGWLMERAPQQVAAAINHMRTRDRARMRKQPSSPFAEAARQHDRGNPEPLRKWLDTSRYEVENNVVRKLGDMTPDDCKFAAGRYRTTARSHGFEAIFLEVLGQKVAAAGGVKVGDVYDEVAITRLRETIARQYPG